MTAHMSRRMRVLQVRLARWCRGRQTQGGPSHFPSCCYWVITVPYLQNPFVGQGQPFLGADLKIHELRCLDDICFCLLGRREMEVSLLPPLFSFPTFFPRCLELASLQRRANLEVTVKCKVRKVPCIEGLYRGRDLLEPLPFSLLLPGASSGLF